MSQEPQDNSDKAGNLGLEEFDHSSGTLFNWITVPSSWRAYVISESVGQKRMY